MNDNLEIWGRLAYVHKDCDGNILGEGACHNQIQRYMLEQVVDAIAAGTCSDVANMEVGTGVGASNTSTHLVISASSNELAVATEGGTNITVAFASTFTALTATITEAGLFPHGTTGISSTSYMMAYNDGLNVVLTSSDTLLLTWTISTAST